MSQPETLAAYQKKVNEIVEHVLGMEDDALFTTHPEWETIVAQAKEIKKLLQ